MWARVVLASSEIQSARSIVDFVDGPLLVRSRIDGLIALTERVLLRREPIAHNVRALDFPDCSFELQACDGIGFTEEFVVGQVL